MVEITSYEPCLYLEIIVIKKEEVVLVVQGGERGFGGLEGGFHLCLAAESRKVCTVCELYCDG